MGAEEPKSREKPEEPGLANPGDALFWALAGLLLLQAVPYGALLAYPAELFATLLHETGHAAAIYLTGGHVAAAEIALDGTGRLESVGGSGFASAVGGHLTVLLFGIIAIRLADLDNGTRALVGAGVATLVGGVYWMSSNHSLTPFLGIGVGATFIFLGRHYKQTGRDDSKSLFIGTMALIGSAVYLVMTGNVVVWATLFASAGGLVVLGILGTRRITEAATLVVGAELLLDPLAELQSLILPPPAYPGQGHSDATALAHLLGGPPILWGLAMSLVGLGFAGTAVLWLDESEDENSQA